MAPPNNQPRSAPNLHAPPLAPSSLPGRRLALTFAPTFASFRMPLLGRLSARHAGVGLGLEGDLQLARWIWLRGLASYTAHPLEESRTQDPDSLAVLSLANAGTMHVLNGGVSGVVGVDIGRWSPLLDVGVGTFRIGTPTGLLAGQRDQPCIDASGCDTGMVCGADNVCRPGLLPELHAGLSLEMQLRRHLAVGFLLRYFALLTAPLNYPVYLTAAVRLTARF
jgi:hypothetical protein